MAAIDKLYATMYQYHDFRLWLFGHNPDLVAHLYRHDDEWDKTSTRAISCFSEAEDKWLLENCPLEWVTNQIRDQYDLNPGENL